jgi:hypothetical protein
MPVGKLRKKYDFFFASLKSMKKGDRSISQRYGSGVPDPDPDRLQNVTDPQHCFLHLSLSLCFLLALPCDEPHVKHFLRITFGELSGLNYYVM